MKWAKTFLTYSRSFQEPRPLLHIWIKKYPLEKLLCAPLGTVGKFSPLSLSHDQ